MVSIYVYIYIYYIYSTKVAMRHSFKPMIGSPFWSVLIVLIIIYLFGLIVLVILYIYICMDLLNEPKLIVLTGFTVFFYPSIQWKYLKASFIPHIVRAMFTAFLCFAGECIDRSGWPPTRDHEWSSLISIWMGDICGIDCRLLVVSLVWSRGGN